MGKTSRFVQGHSSEGDLSVGFNTALAGLKDLPIHTVQAPSEDTSATLAAVDKVPASAPTTDGGVESVAEAVAAIAADNVVDHAVASSGDVAITSTDEPAKRAQKTHLGRAPLRSVPAAAPSAETKSAEIRTPQRTSTPTPEPSNEEWVELEHFLKFSNIDFVSLVRVVKAKGFRPMLCVEIDTPNAYSRVEFSLALVPGDRVEMTVRGGDGFFAGLLARRKFFRDEVFGDTIPNPPRVHTTRGMRALLEVKCSLIDAEASR